MLPITAIINSDLSSEKASVVSVYEDSARDVATLFVHEPEATCSAYWRSWPAVQEKAIADKTVIVFDILPSVGNLFIALRSLAKVGSHRRRATVWTGAVLRLPMCNCRKTKNQ